MSGTYDYAMEKDLISGMILSLLHENTLTRTTGFEEMNNGKVRVLFGSTAMLGTGVNAQQRAVAVHQDVYKRQTIDGLVHVQGNLFHIQCIFKNYVHLAPSRTASVSYTHLG